MSLKNRVVYKAVYKPETLLHPPEMSIITMEVYRLGMLTVWITPVRKAKRSSNGVLYCATLNTALNYIRTHAGAEAKRFNLRAEHFAKKEKDCLRRADNFIQRIKRESGVV